MASKKEKMIRLLQYLKKYTDKDNPTSMPLIDYYFEQKGLPNFFGAKSSKRKVKREIVKELAYILNTDLYGNPLPKEDWVIVYDGYDKSDEQDREFICNLYYAQPFSKWEVEDIRKSIDMNTELDEEKKSLLKMKIKKYLSNENYEANDPYLKRGVGPVDKKKYLIEKKRTAARHRAAIRYKEQEW